MIACLNFTPFAFLFLSKKISQVLGQGGGGVPREAVVSPFGTCAPGGPESSGSSPPRVGGPTALSSSHHPVAPGVGLGGHHKDIGEHAGSPPAPSAFLVLFSLLSFSFRETVAQRAGSCFYCPGSYAWLPVSNWRLPLPQLCPLPWGIASGQLQVRDKWGTRRDATLSPYLQRFGRRGC